MSDHITQMRSHAMRRLWQRKGIALTERQYADLCIDVASRSHECVAEGYSGRVFVPVSKFGMLAVFDTKHQVIASFVPQVPRHTARLTG